MDIIKDLKNLVDKYPNNMELGKKVRQYVWNYIKNKENKEQI